MWKSSLVVCSGLCAGLFLLAGCSCEVPAPEPSQEFKQHGETCFSKDKCVEGLTCHAFECRTPKEVEQYDEEERLFNEKAAREAFKKEADLLKQSGVKAALKVEKVRTSNIEEVSTAKDNSMKEGCIGCVRVVVTQGDSPIFAACQPEERLISGSCKAKDSYISISASYPSHFSENDTLGARWNCEGRSKYAKKPIEAYALCKTVTLKTK